MYDMQTRPERSVVMNEINAELLLDLITLITLSLMAFCCSSCKASPVITGNDTFNQKRQTIVSCRSSRIRLHGQTAASDSGTLS